MKKRLFISLTFLVLLCIFFGAITVSAAEARTGKCGDELNYSLSSDGVMTISGKGAMWDFRDDPVFDYHPRPWESFAQEIKKVVFQPGITHVGVDAFRYCESLTQVVFTDTITSIGQFSFINCINLEDFTLPKNLGYLGQQAFQYCEKITEVRIPDSVTFLDGEIFNGCRSLTYLYIGSGADGGSYVYCSGPIGFCENLESIEVSEDNYALTAVDGILYNKDLTELVEYPGGKKDKVYVMPVTIERISRFSAWECKYIETIVFPASLNYIDVCSFTWCTNLKKVCYDGTAEQWQKVVIGEDNDPILQAELCLSAQCAHKYTNACDTTCDNCYKSRTVTHTYVNGSCSCCGRVMQAKLVKKNGQWQCIVDGSIYTENTLVKYNGNWYHVKGGKWVRDTGFVKYNGKAYYVKDGLWNKTTTLIKISDGSWVYVKNGVQDMSNTLVKHNGSWYHVNGGKWVKDTTLVKYDGRWLYVRNGVYTNMSTFVKFNGGTYYVKNGVYQNVSGFVQHNGAYYFLRSGVLDTTNALVKDNGRWYHLDAGKWVRDTTLVERNGATYYVKNGVVDFGFTGKFQYNGKTYNIVKGVVK